MGRVNHIHNSFVSGEVSPKYRGRTDTNQYNSACEEIRNFIVYPQGGVSRRPGSRYIICKFPRPMEQRLTTFACFRFKRAMDPVGKSSLQTKMSIT